MTETLFIITSLFAFLLLLLICYYFQTEAINALNKTAIGNNTAAMAAITTSRANFTAAADQLPVALAAILIIASAALGFVLPTHFVFIVLGIILLFPVLFISGLLGDVFSVFVNSTVLNTTTAFFPNTVTVGSNLPMIALIADIVFLFAMFVKRVVSNV